eukprot:6486219-Amphidinium_carterae.3
MGKFGGNGLHGYTARVQSCLPAPNPVIASGSILLGEWQDPHHGGDDTDHCKGYRSLGANAESETNTPDCIQMF